MAVAIYTHKRSMSAKFDFVLGRNLVTVTWIFVQQTKKIYIEWIMFQLVEPLVSGQIMFLDDDG